MQHNLDRRVEQLFSLREPRRHDRVWRLLKLAYTVNAWELKPDGSFVRLHPRGRKEPLDSKALLLEEGT